MFGHGHNPKDFIFKATKPEGELDVWKNRHGDVVTRAYVQLPWPLAETDEDFHARARDHGASREAGLIEAIRDDGRGYAWWIHKRKHGLGYVFMGMRLWRHGIWSTMIGECGTTGVREAAVTQDLLNSGELTFETYEERFGGDPYDPAKAVSEVRLRRFLSDDPKWDKRFPEHALTRTRLLLHALPGAVTPA